MSAPLWRLIYRRGGLSENRPIAAVRADLAARLGRGFDRPISPAAPAPPDLERLIEADYPIEIDRAAAHFDASGRAHLPRIDGRGAVIAEDLIRLIEIGRSYQTTAAGGPIRVLDSGGAAAALIAVML